eukprot:CAMPEP_0172749366 /NCGR_PEP_ID=MMETSP1074-20121228/147170_1 /TAXON_ID=2916 /ORGANISM="Ceratium fusus, Strain PA161109" /LENGTH=71 /DNA_ID=CAMNT_0013581309 /DNA_START=55 /DNA_END=267 /DNA_ORIENTATION=-
MAVCLIEGKQFALDVWGNCLYFTAHGKSSAHHHALDSRPGRKKPGRCHSSAQQAPASTAWRATIRAAWKSA